MIKNVKVGNKDNVVKMEKAYVLWWDNNFLELSKAYKHEKMPLGPPLHRPRPPSCLYPKYFFVVKKRMKKGAVHTAEWFVFITRNFSDPQNPLMKRGY